METANYIEAYIRQDLEATERVVFEQKLADDKTFAEEVKAHTLLLNSFDEIKAIEIKSQFDKIEAELKEDKVSTSTFHPLLKWAAVFAFFMMGTTWYLWSNQQSNEELFLAYYSTYPNVETPAVRSDANQQGAWRLYNNGEYEDAYQQFQHSINNGNNEEATWFYLGISAIELNRYNQAEKAFTTVTGKQNGRFKEQAEWYLALVYLKAEKLNEAKATLKKITGSNSSYADKAEALLAKL